MTARIALLLLCSVAVAACGSDESGDPGGAPFASRAGALREIGQLAWLRIDERVLFGARNGDARFIIALGAPAPSDCESGTVSVQEGVKARSFEYYAKTGEFRYLRSQFSDCTPPGNAGESVIRGILERGEEAEHDPTNVSDSFDQYAVYGDEALGSGYAQTLVLKDAGGTVTAETTEELLGSVEWRDADIGRVAGSVLTRRLVRNVPDAHSLEWRQGRADEPLYVDAGLGQSLSVEGPYAWNSSSCSADSGFRRITAGIARDDDGYPSGGQLTIVAGSESFTATFDAGGNAVVSFSNGNTVTLDAGEVRAALDEPACW
jgi:hypothetical protein